MVLRQSKNGEKITTLDGKSFTLPGGDIVIEDGKGRLIDLAGVMGGNLSMVTESTKNVLLFVQTYNPAFIRKTSMSLAQRTLASTIFEKGIDPELVADAILAGVELFENVCKATSESEILNIHPKPYKAREISLNYDEITKKLGVEIPKSEISGILSSLEFETSWTGGKLGVIPPSFRNGDVLIPEDVIEEVARIYGYYKLPSKLMDGELPDYPQDRRFEFEEKLKNILAGFGGCEIYTLSLVSKDYVVDGALKLKNPLGSDSEYLRTSLMPSMVSAAKENVSQESFHLFEVSNSYIPRAGDLSEEKLTLAGIFKGYGYRDAKGILEAFFLRLHVENEFRAEDMGGFAASKSAAVFSKGRKIGKIGITEEGYIYYEFGVEEIYKLADREITYKEISKYPSQVEDITFNFPDKTRMGDVCRFISSLDDSIGSVDYVGSYANAHTINVKFHSDKKTLTDADVEVIRKRLISSVKTKFGGMVKG